jgi:hypothetical protein
VVYRLRRDGGPGPADSALDPNFGSHGRVPIPTGGYGQSSAVLLQPDRKIVAVGLVKGRLGAFRLFGTGFGRRTLVRLALGDKRIPAAGPLPVVVSNRNDFLLRGKLRGRTAKRVAVSSGKKRRIALEPEAFSARAHGKTTVRLDLPQKVRELLADAGEVKLRLSATVRDPSGTTRTVTKTVTAKLR